MANGRFLGVFATGLAASIPTLSEQGTGSGIVHKMLDSYTLLADLASGDQIQMGAPIPEGARMMGAKVACKTGLGGSCTLNFGWLASTDLNPDPNGITVGETLNASDLTAFFSALPVSSATYATAYGSTYQGDFYNQVLTSSVQCVVSEQAVSSGATGFTIQVEVDFITY